jgi:hypothetical protein
MRNTTSLTFDWKSTAIVAVLAWWFSAFPAAAQQGQDAVYNSSGVVTNSPSFIDASQFGNSHTDICAVLNFILNPADKILPAAGAVIDARGLPGTTGTSMMCSISPWGSGSGYLNVPSTILLPAGTIVIPTKWVLPSNTHLVGEGSAISGLFTLATTLQVSSSFTANTPMIQFGSSSGCCSGISLYSCANTTKCTTDTLYGCQGTNGWHGIQ